MSSYSAIDLEESRKQPSAALQPFPHQKEAFKALDRVFSFEDRSPKAALLVLPTGAGKTFTSVNWVCRKGIPSGVRVLWLAQSVHLLDQALASFHDNARHIPPPARFLNVRTVSSHPSHDKINAIQPTDDVIIVTTQTAISALNRETLGLNGRPFTSKLETFIRKAERTGLIVILDEAHHAPAYGCRGLLTKVRELVPHMALLGLTATPTYTDETKRGWLGKIFTEGVAYQAKQASLMAQNILAKPVYREMATGLELEVDDKLYRRLVQEHKDLPDDLVDQLAKNSARNDYIVKHYADNAAAYGKTLIFADRWFQCVYIANKLQKHKIRAAAVFSHVDGAGAEDGPRRSTTVENEKNIRRFKNNELDVLVNVRMLTEGTDVPDICSVFVTRQTTSSILLTQMVGRALRGKRAGGGDDKDQANIVLFVDKWKHLLDVWATPDMKGGIETTRPVCGSMPMEYIAIHLVEALSRRIENPETPVNRSPFLDHIPVGWYRTEYSLSVRDDETETIEHVCEFVMIFEGVKQKYAHFIDSVFPDLPAEWGKEHLDSEWIDSQVEGWIKTFFADEADDFGQTLARNLASIARHMGANGSRPEFLPFAERDQFNLDRLAEKLYPDPSPVQLDALRAEFDKDGNLWRVFYKSSFDWFKMDFDAAIYRIYQNQKHGSVGRSPGKRPAPRKPIGPISREELARLREQVLIRDNNTCQACGAQGKGVKLEIDHIVSRDHGGPETIDNLQILCSICNSARYKGVNDINFRSHSTPLSEPKPGQFLAANGSEDVERSLRRLVNFFYHCGAVCAVKTSQKRNAKNYATWEIELYAPNPPEWLEQCKLDLIEHIATNFDCPHVTDVLVR